MPKDYFRTIRNSFRAQGPQPLLRAARRIVNGQVKRPGTRLNEAGGHDKDIQAIPRRADVSTTQAFYILPNRDRAEAGLKKLDKTLRTKYGIKA